MHNLHLGRYRRHRNELISDQETAKWCKAAELLPAAPDAILRLMLSQVSTGHQQRQTFRLCLNVWPTISQKGKINKAIAQVTAPGYHLFISSVRQPASVAVCSALVDGLLTLIHHLANSPNRTNDSNGMRKKKYASAPPVVLHLHLTLCPGMTD